MQFELHPKIECRFTLSDLELEILLSLSAEHYDAKCRNASSDDGFISGWKKIHESYKIIYPDEPNKDLELCAFMTEIDTCLKILEISSLLFYDRDSEEYKTSMKLRNAFYCIFSKANDKYKDWYDNGWKGPYISK